MSDCQEWRELLGAFALGSLRPEERTALLAHIDGCSQCRAELAELEDVRRALDSVEIDRVVSNVPPEHLYGEIFSRIEEERRHDVRTRRKLKLGAALASAAVVIALLINTFWSSGEVVEFASTPRGVDAVAVITEESGGVGIHLTVDGLEPGTYALWMEGYSGARLPAGTFEVVGGATVEGDFLVGWSRDECHNIGVSIVDGDEIFSTELPHVSG